ncbi:MAG: hypothetical protein QM599_05405 [Pseudoxanthomonas sp.]
MSPRRRIVRTTALTAAVAIAVALPADSAPPATPPTQVWIDVATYNMASMPDMGALGRLAMKMGGADKQQTQPNKTFPTTRRPGQTGTYLDVALLNQLKPGATADMDTPNGLGLGTLTLMPPPPSTSTQGVGVQDDPPDVEVTIEEYWGCGGSPGPGQPKVATFKVKSGVASSTGSMSPGIFKPQDDIKPTTAYVLWPNKVSGQPVPEGASMVGTHRFKGQGIPASLQFDLARNADFMPKIALTSQMGEDRDPIDLSWQPVDRAQAYFITAVQMEAPTDSGNGKSGYKLKGTMWSSAEVGGAGESLLDYLNPSDLGKWLKQKVLLSPDTIHCTIPQGIFGNGNGGLTIGSPIMLDMAAYGPETTLLYPPKPTDPKQLAAWKPEWSVRVRSKSTANAIAGMNPDEDDATRKESIGKKLFKNLLKGKL